jgi:chromosome segregation ATPase
MDTASKKPQEARLTDRLLEALGTLAALMDRTINEVKSLDIEFQNRVLRAVHDAEASLQSQAAQQLDQALAESRTKLEEQFKGQLVEVTAEWEAERARLNSAIDRAAQAGTEWEAERARLNSEIERLTQSQATAEAEAEKARAKASAAQASAASEAKAGSQAQNAVLLKEVERVEGLIKQISALIEDSSTELSTVIRKNVERAELEAYLKGIRYAINGSR